MGLVYVLMSSGFDLVMAVPNIIFIAFGEVLLQMSAPSSSGHGGSPPSLATSARFPIAVVALTVLEDSFYLQSCS